MSRLSVRRLRHDEIDDAYVLASLGYDSLSLDDWRAMAAAQLDRSEADGGVLIAIDATGRERGLLIYRVTSTLTGARSLQVERLIGFDLIDPKAVADVLIAEMLRLGRLQDCESLSLVRPFDAPHDAAAYVLRSGVVALHRVF